MKQLQTFVYRYGHMKVPLRKSIYMVGKLHSGIYEAGRKKKR